MNVEKLVKAYIKLRDTRTQLSREFDEQDGALKEKQQRLEAELLKYLNMSGVDSMTTPAGTVYKQEEVTPTGSNWESFYEWVAKNNAFDALERRIKKTFVKEYMETHNGGVPPGVSVFREFVVRIRRK